MTAYARKPLTATARCPICSWVKTYFQNDKPKLEVKYAAALGQVAHILSDHSAPKRSRP
jgi:hypothetical protein